MDNVKNKLKSHKDLDVWMESMKMTKEIYTMTKSFPKEEIYGLVSQMRRCAVSIPSNIAEGAARSSKKEFIQFLYISMSSLSELETQYIISKELGFTKENSGIEDLINRIRKMLIGLINFLKNKK
jgi:four helix bundle protein